jgi:hypothetical protein
MSILNHEMFRMPLNAFVVLLLLKIKNLSPKIVFSICTGTHAVAFLAYGYFYLSSKEIGKEYNETGLDLSKSGNIEIIFYSVSIKNLI